MRLIPLLLTLALGAMLPAPTVLAADGAAVTALLINASNQKGGSDRRLAPYDATLRRNLPFDTFRLAGEGSARINAGGHASVSLGRGHQLSLHSESGRGAGIHLKVDWTSGGKTLMSTSLTLQPGVPAVLGRRGGGDGEVPVVLLVAR